MAILKLKCISEIRTGADKESAEELCFPGGPVMNYINNCTYKNFLIK